MNSIMQNLRNKAPDTIAKKKVVAFGDYLKGKYFFADCERETALPLSNVLCYLLDGGDSIYIRPSGTEPKVKVYYFSSGKTKEEALINIENYKKEFKAILA